MKIEIDNKYTLMQVAKAPTVWDLYVKGVSVNKKTRETTDVLRSLAFGVTIEYAVERIIAEEFSNNESIVSLKEYVEAFKAERDRILSILGI